MSGRWKVRVKSAAAYLLTAALVWGPLLIAIHPLHSEPSKQAAQSTQSYSNGQPEPDGFWAIKIGDVLTLFILLVQAAIFAVQAYLAHKQRMLMHGQLTATEKTADIALVALDRPWLFLDITENNRQNWLSGFADLEVRFQIRNYGKAPAIIHAFRAVIFFSFGEDGRNGPFGKQPIELPFIVFPKPNDLTSFIFRSGRLPVQRVYSRETVDQDVDRIWKSTYQPIRFDTPIVLINGASTDGYVSTYPNLADTISGAIPLAAAADMYFVGHILYWGPGEVMEVLTFCYKANHRGDLQMHLGPPYNERKKA